MSYDLMVFDGERAPRTREEFVKWFEQQVKWEEPHSYMDPAVTTPALREWFMEMKETFPQMNGPFAPDDDEFDAMDEAGTSHYVTDYSIGRAVIYAAFAWSLVEEAYEQAGALAVKHKVGFFDVSNDNGQILFPDGLII